MLYAVCSNAFLQYMTNGRTLLSLAKDNGKAWTRALDSQRLAPLKNVDKKTTTKTTYPKTSNDKDRTSWAEAGPDVMDEFQKVNAAI